MEKNKLIRQTQLLSQFKIKMKKIQMINQNNKT